MAKTGTSSRFVSMNLSKSYGPLQPPATGHGSSISSVPGSSFSHRGRLQRGHSGMVILSRPGRSQPCVSSSSSRTSKLAIPRPVNLPSLRREHAGNDPTVSLVGTSGSTGWSKQSVISTRVDSSSASRGAQTDSEEDNLEQNGLLSQSGAPSCQAPSTRSRMYLPSSSRNSNAGDSHSMQRDLSEEKAIFMRGENFPTLQAAVRPLTSPTLQGVQHYQRNKPEEVRDHHVKVRELPQQQITKVDQSNQSKLCTNSFLQPARPHEAALPRGASTGHRLHYSVDFVRGSEKVANNMSGPLPLIRWTHTSNWDDDERETLQNARGEVSRQSDSLGAGLPQNGRTVFVNRFLHHNEESDIECSTSSVFSGVKEHRDIQDHRRNGGFIAEGQSTQDPSLRRTVHKNLPNQHVEVGSWEHMITLSSVPRRDLSKHEWTYVSKEVNSNRDGRSGKSNDLFSSKPLGPSNKEMQLSAYKTVDLSCRGNGVNKLIRDSPLGDGRSRVDGNISERRLDDRQAGRYRKAMGGYQSGWPDSYSTARLQGGARNDLLGLTFGRERRVSNEPRGFKSNQSILFELFEDFSGFDAKVIGRKKDELLSFHDPERELFEAELEKVQNMQELERQRLAEERERAIELVRKEEEEREIVAREKELMRLKLEEDAREAASQAQREQEEAARKIEETRRAREDQKRSILLEEERRKDAARKKLLELEHRMALRESGQIANAGFLEKGRLEDSWIRSKCQAIQTLDNVKRTDDDVSNRVTMPVRSVNKEFTEGLQTIPLATNFVKQGTEPRGADSSSKDRNRIVQTSRAAAFKDVSVPHFMMESHGPQDFSSGKADQRRLSVQEMSVRPTRSTAFRELPRFCAARGQEMVLLNSFTRKGLSESGYGDQMSTLLSSDANKTSSYSGFERDSEVRWGMHNQGKSQEGQRLNSPPPFSDTIGGGENEYRSFGRVRQSLPKQPKVPLPIFGRPILRKQIIQSESIKVITPQHHEGDLANVSKTHFPNNRQKLFLESSTEQDDHPHLDNVQHSLAGEPVLGQPNDTIAVHAHHESNVYDNTATCLKDVLHACSDEIPQPDEIDLFSEQLSDLSESEEQPKDDTKQATVGMNVLEGVKFVNDKDDGWVAEGSARNADEEFCDEEEQSMEAVKLDLAVLDKQQLDSLKIHEDITSSLEHGTEEEIDCPTWESQLVDCEENGDVNELDGPTDSHLESDKIVSIPIRLEDEMHDSKETISSPQRSMKSDPADVQGESLANLPYSVLARPLEGHNSAQPFIQPFQQPFSFMAVPLAQSTTMSGVPWHPPSLPPVHKLSAQHDLPYTLRRGLFPSTPVVPNAIQIGSIQMPLQVHPQMPSVAYHHQQPPVFQFGQLCQFSQPVSPMQSAFQMHHVLGQPLLAQHHQNELSSTTENSKLSPISNPTKQSEDVLGRLSSGSRVIGDGPANSLLDGSPTPKGPLHRDSGAGLATLARDCSAPMDLSPKNSTTLCGDFAENMHHETPGSMNWTSDIWNHVAYGTSGGISDGPCDVAQTLIESQWKEAPQSSAMQQSNHVAEYVAHKQQGFEKAELVLNQEIQDLEYRQPGNVERISRDDTLDQRFYLQSFSGIPQLGETDLVSRQPQVGFRRTKADSSQTCIGSTSKPNNDLSEACSKHQLLGEQCETQDKNMTEGLKVKEQNTSKQDKVIGKSVVQKEATFLSPGRCLLQGTHSSSDNARHGKHQSSAKGTNLQQFEAYSNCMDFPAAAVTEPKVFKSLKHEPGAALVLADTQEFGHGYPNSSNASINTAWGVQKVCSSTKLQPDEATRPVACDGVISLMAPVPDRCIALEQGKLPLCSSFIKFSAPFKDSVSVSGPISSLLAGEKMQFGAVTSPPVISAPSCPSSPFIGAIGSQFTTNEADFLSHPSSLARKYANLDSTDALLCSKVGMGMEDNTRGQPIDAEAEADAMAAASAIAVAAISNDEGVKHFSGSSVNLNDRNPVENFASCTQTLGCRTMQAPSKSMGVDNKNVATLPGDLSVDTTAGSSVSMLRNLPSTCSSFSGLEVGTNMGGPVLAYGPREEPGTSSFEPGLAGLGAGSLGPWQQRFSNSSDSFYGAPPPFMSPTGLSGIQAHPHMLIYTSPLPQVGHFGQLGMNFMGTAYHPSGKQPDWSHIPYTSSEALLSQNGRDMNEAKPLLVDVQLNELASNSLRAISAPGPPAMPVPVPMSVFDPSLGSPFQVHWTKAPSPVISNYHISRSPGLDFQHRLNELGFPPEALNGTTNLQEPLETTASYIPNDVLVAASTGTNSRHVPEECGISYPSMSGRSVESNIERLFSRGDHLEAVVLGGGLQQPPSMNGNSHLGSGSSNMETILPLQDLRISSMENPHTKRNEMHQQEMMDDCLHSSPSVDRKASHSMVSELPASHPQRASSQSVFSVSSGDRGPALSVKSKHIYVAKPATAV